MGWIKPSLPDLDVAEWRSRPHLQRIKPLAQHWVDHGFGTPYAIHLLYVAKVAGYAIGGLAVAAATPGIGSLGNVSSWWFELVVYQKIVIWTLLWEVLGLGCGSGPLTLRFLPPLGGLLYWLRPGTVRLAPWPRIPLTGGTRRGPLDVALYLAVLASAVWLLLSPGDPSSIPPGNTVGLIDPVRMVPLVVALAVLGLRDKTIFLAARGEHYWVTLLVFALPYLDMVLGLKLIMVALWWGAATSKLNRHFPFVVAVMISNSPLQRVKWLKRKFYRNFPEDLRPSRLAGFAAHTGTVIEFTVPTVLLFSNGGTVTMAALAIMVLFHTHIFSTFPMGVPLEWNVFFVYSALVLFGHYSGIGFSDASAPLLVALLAAGLAAVLMLGNVMPRLVSFLPSMRYYAGNWATSLWCFQEGAEEVLDRRIRKASGLPVTQLSRLYGQDVADMLLYKGLAWRAMHTHGRALMGLLPRTVPDLNGATIREGEAVAGMVLGWNFGDGHLHNESLLRAVQERCGFAEGELRVLILESQPIHRQCQHYRIVDAATGLVEEGYVDVADMVSRQPWLDSDGAFPVRQLRRDPTAVTLSR
ncbi:membrane protein [Rhizocola hellebori]|uniref:Membrane protein n=1 Tax=Rhizocola hellebori TaxID=1392758 RepID=A0A8J3QGT5_9ACTN|nr:DUF3556 domain-containing protein [Rhizocola hellebori]GIH09455.1 membrane protein [Rhizocola hellebori]